MKICLIREMRINRSRKPRSKVNPMVISPILNSRNISLVKEALTSPLNAASSPLPSQMPRTLQNPHLFTCSSLSTDVYVSGDYMVLSIQIPQTWEAEKISSVQFDYVFPSQNNAHVELKMRA